MPIPRLFVSYCWSTPDHEKWVVDLSTELVESGVEVILDKWDLREGHDAVAFMESMVTDPSINKVIIVCDRAYSEKADGRMGGVGTETQIISQKVYESTSQDKFVAVVAERDTTGKAYLPTYYKSRIYIDLSQSDKYGEGFEQLLRWIFDKPLYVKPQIGTPPAFLSEDPQTTLGTSALAKRAINATKNDKSYARGAFEEYLSTFASNLERYRINPKDGELDDLIVAAIETLTPARNEFLQVLSAFLQYGEPGGTSRSVHRFFESALSYYSPRDGQSSFIDTEFDHYKFIVHELFLYAEALYLRADDFASSDYLLGQTYYLTKNIERGRDTSGSFTVIQSNIKSLDIRNKRMALNRLSLHADMLEQRSKSSAIPFRYLMQADFICFMRAQLSSTDRYARWWPETLLYSTRHYGPFEAFARAASKAQLARLLPVLGVTSLAEVKAKLDEFAATGSLPRWQFQSFDPAGLMEFDKLGTKA